MHAHRGGACMMAHCECAAFAQARATSEFPAAEPAGEFGLPSALRGAYALSDAAMSAALSALIELRLLIASVDDVLTAPAPTVQASSTDPEHLRNLESMVRHRTAIERLSFSQKNARRALSYFDTLREGTIPPSPGSPTERVQGDAREESDAEREELVLAAREVLRTMPADSYPGQFARGVLEHFGAPLEVH
jgi:hypothetical protein